LLQLFVETPLRIIFALPFKRRGAVFAKYSFSKVDSRELVQKEEVVSVDIPDSRRIRTFFE
jgi:hypothetical protein